MPYTLASRLQTDPTAIMVVGCGGTGGFVAEGLCRLLGDQPATILLVDHDRVEPHNLRRQAFYAGDLGKFKSQALAERLSRSYGREVAYTVFPFDRQMLNTSWGGGWVTQFSGLIIGCVDNALARKEIALACKAHVGYSAPWWIDAGNGEHSGQVLVGNSVVANLKGQAFDETKECCYLLPLPSVQQADLLVPPVEPEPDLDCAEAIETGDQSPTINQQMATLVLEFVSRFMAGTLSWMSAYVDLEAGSLRTVEASPNNVARMLGLKEESLMDKQPHRALAR